MNQMYWQHGRSPYWQPGDITVDAYYGGRTLVMDLFTLAFDAHQIDFDRNVLRCESHCKENFPIDAFLS